MATKGWRLWKVEGAIIEDDAGRNNALGIHRLSMGREFRMPTRGDVRVR